MAKTPTDKEIIGEIGTAALVEAGFTEDSIKKWRKRGIPWYARVKVAAVASRRRVWLPADFLQERRAA
jgi:hypothetical protein